MGILLCGRRADAEWASHPLEDATFHAAHPKRTFASGHDTTWFDRARSEAKRASDRALPPTDQWYLCVDAVGLLRHAAEVQAVFEQTKNSGRHCGPEQRPVPRDSHERIE
jgi:hypothetical protein